MRFITIISLLLTQGFLWSIANAGVVLYPPPPTKISELDFGSYIKVRQNDSKLDFDLKSGNGNYTVKKEGGETFIFSEKKSDKGLIRDEFSSKTEGNKQTVIRLSGHTYDSNSKPSQGAYSGTVWQFENGKMLNYTQCENTNYAAFGALNIPSSKAEYCMTLTPSGCQSLLKELAGLEKLTTDIEACARVSDSILKISKHIEPDPLYGQNLSLLNEQSKGKNALVGLQPGKTVSETLYNEIRTLDRAKGICNELMSLWTAQGQVTETTGSKIKKEEEIK